MTDLERLALAAARRALEPARAKRHDHRGPGACPACVYLTEPDGQQELIPSQSQHGPDREPEDEQIRADFA